RSAAVRARTPGSGSQPEYAPRTCCTSTVRSGCSGGRSRFWGGQRRLEAPSREPPAVFPRPGLPYQGTPFRRPSGRSLVRLFGRQPLQQQVVEVASLAEPDEAADFFPRLYVYLVAVLHLKGELPIDGQNGLVIGVDVDAHVSALRQHDGPVERQVRGDRDHQ